MTMTRVVIHTTWGGFNLTPLALATIRTDSGNLDIDEWTIKRDDPHLVSAVEKLGDKAGENLMIVEIPNDVESWYIHDYDGMESIHEAHRTWG